MRRDSNCVLSLAVPATRLLADSRWGTRREARLPDRVADRPATRSEEAFGVFALECCAARDETLVGARPVVRAEAYEVDRDEAREVERDVERDCEFLPERFAPVPRVARNRLSSRLDI